MFGRKSREKIRQLQAAMSAEVETTERLKGRIEELNEALRSEGERADRAESELATVRAANKALKALNSRLTKKLNHYTDKKDGQKE